LYWTMMSTVAFGSNPSRSFAIFGWLAKADAAHRNTIVLSEQIFMADPRTVNSRPFTGAENARRKPYLPACKLMKWQGSTRSTHPTGCHLTGCRLTTWHPQDVARTSPNGPSEAIRTGSLRNAPPCSEVAPGLPGNPSAAHRGTDKITGCRELRAGTTKSPRTNSKPLSKRF